MSDIDNKLMLRMYRRMVMIRLFEDRCRFCRLLKKRSTHPYRLRTLTRKQPCTCHKKISLIPNLLTTKPQRTEHSRRTMTSDALGNPWITSTLQLRLTLCRPCPVLGTHRVICL